MNKLLFQLGLLTCLLGQKLITIDRYEITANEISEHIRFLSSDRLKGRYPGTPGSKTALHYIEKNWKKVGILPGGDWGFKQTFIFSDDISISGYNRVKINETKKSFRIGRDFNPLGFSGVGQYDGPVVFCGYGFNVTDSLSWDDYRSVDVSGKWALVFRGGPDGRDQDSQYSDYIPLRKKYLAARDHGAVGILFVNRFNDENQDDLIPLTFSRSSGGEKIAALHLSQSLSELLLPAGVSLNDLQTKLDKNKASVSMLTPNSLSVKIGLKEKKIKGVNLVGNIPGDGSTDEVLVIGAHRDHLGYGGENSGSLSPYEYAIHNGADDNASGIAGLLELAEKFAARSESLKRGLLFVAFDGEEKGLLGSKYFVEHPTAKMENIVTMINMDMVGRLKETTLSVGGTGTSPGFEIMLDSLQLKHGLKLSYNQGGYGPSDHSSFYTKKTPVLFFFTGAHEDYHKPSDDWEKINADGEKQILDLIYDVITVLSNEKEKPPFTSAGSKEPPSSRRKFKVTFGIIPSYTGSGPGFAIDGVRPDGPADRAGLISGDTVVEIGGKKVEDIYDYMYRLGELKKGETVEVKVRRGEEILILLIDL